MEERAARIFRCAVGYFYQHFARGCRRVVFDGLEPTERFSESIQFEFFEYIYHHVLRKEDEWAAREWLREKYRTFEQQVHGHRYDQSSVGCLYLYTTPQIMLDELLVQPISQGDIFANANTIILMGRTRHNGRLGRALTVTKHRGSACSEEILPYRITEEAASAFSIERASIKRTTPPATWKAGSLIPKIMRRGVPIQVTSRRMIPTANAGSQAGFSFSCKERFLVTRSTAGRAERGFAITSKAVKWLTNCDKSMEIHQTKLYLQIGKIYTESSSQ